MRKNLFWFAILALFIILFLLIAKPVRTTKTMESIAKSELKDEPFYVFTRKNANLYRGLEGPIIIDRQERVQFSWYKVLEWGDTATISAFVYKSFFKELCGIFRAKNPPSVIADIKWYYVFVPEGISKFNDILPRQFNKLDISKFKLKDCEQNKHDSIVFLVKPERLLFFLKKGFFQLVEKSEKYSTIDFYQPVATIIDKQTKRTVTTNSARIYFFDSLKVQISPCKVPITVRNIN